MPLKDTDFLTAAMTVRAPESTLFDRERTARLIEARGDDEVCRLLAEGGYEVSAPLTAEGLYKALAAAREKVFSQTAKWLPEGGSALLDTFRVPYDYHNIKVLLKGENSESLLVGMGRVSPQTLTEALRELVFSRLPGSLGEAAKQARETLDRTNDPQSVDFLLDKACIAEMREYARLSGSGFLREYMRLYTDAYNLRSAVRAARIGKGSDARMLAPGGHVEVTRLHAALQSGVPLADLFRMFARAAEAGTAASRGEGPLTEFEKLCDDVLLDYARKARSVAFGEQPLIGYLLEREAESVMLRTVVGGRLGGVPARQIKERLRAAYV